MRQKVKKDKASPGEKDIFAEGRKSWEKEEQQQIIGQVQDATRSISPFATIVMCKFVFV